MSKEGWCVALGQEGLREGGGNCLKHLKRWWEKKRGGKTKILKRGGKLGQGVGALKRGSWDPLMNYDTLQLSVAFL